MEKEGLSIILLDQPTAVRKYECSKHASPWKKKLVDDQTAGWLAARAGKCNRLFLPVTWCLFISAINSHEQEVTIDTELTTVENPSSSRHVTNRE